MRPRDQAPARRRCGPPSEREPQSSQLRASDCLCSSRHRHYARQMVDALATEPRHDARTLTSQVMAEASYPSVSRVGRWRSSMTFYRAVRRDQSLPAPTDLPRDLLGISLHDLPNEYLFVMRSQRLILRAHSSVQTVLDKLQSYKGRFCINFEMEYLPLSSIDKSQRVMVEFYMT